MSAESGFVLIVGVEVSGKHGLHFMLPDVNPLDAFALSKMLHFI
jgi:hypothetical protein